LSETNEKIEAQQAVGETFGQLKPGKGVPLVKKTERIEQDWKSQGNCMSQERTFSIIVPAYNEEEKMPGLIASLRKQTVKPLEAILIDDCSTDQTKQVAADYFNVVTTPKNMGPAAARNLGMKVAKGEYFAFLDADCRPDPDWMEQILEHARDQNQVLTGGYIVEAKSIIGKSIAALGYPCGGSVGFDKMWHVGSDGSVEKISTGNFVIHRSVIDRYGGFDEEFSYCFEDAYFTHCLTQKGVKIIYCPAMDVRHTSRETLGEFIKWHYSRGEGLNLFKQKVGGLKKFVKLRIWSTKNIIKMHSTDFKFPVIMSLLLLSIFLQKYASWVDRVKHSGIMRTKQL